MPSVVEDLESEHVTRDDHLLNNDVAEARRGPCVNNNFILYILTHSVKKILKVSRVSSWKTELKKNYFILRKFTGRCCAKWSYVFLRLWCAGEVTSGALRLSSLIWTTWHQWSGCASDKMGRHPKYRRELGYCAEITEMPLETGLIELESSSNAKSKVISYKWVTAEFCKIAACKKILITDK